MADVDSVPPLESEDDTDAVLERMAKRHGLFESLMADAGFLFSPDNVVLVDDPSDLRSKKANMTPAQLTGLLYGAESETFPATVSPSIMPVWTHDESGIPIFHDPRDAPQRGPPRPPPNTPSFDDSRLIYEDVLADPGATEETHVTSSDANSIYMRDSKRRKKTPASTVRPIPIANSSLKGAPIMWVGSPPRSPTPPPSPERNSNPVDDPMIVDSL